MPRGLSESWSLCPSVIASLGSSPAVSMKFDPLTKSILVALLQQATALAPPSLPTATGSFTYDNGSFFLNGEPFTIIGGQMDPQRIPPEYWRERLAKASAMGLNTIFSYVYWNLLEPEPGEVWNFRGQSSLFRSCSDHHPGPSHFFSQRFPFAACGRCDIQDGEPPFSYSSHDPSHWVVWSLTLVAAVANQ